MGLIHFYCLLRPEATELNYKFSVRKRVKILPMALILSQHSVTLLRGYLDLNEDFIP